VYVCVWGGGRPRRRWDQREGDWLGGVEWIQLAQDRDRWRAVVNTVMNLRVLVTELVCGGGD
jgi:hypothetical protein